MPSIPSPEARPAPRIALIHALSHSVEPVNDLMAQQWPEATRMNLLDDSLSADLSRSDRGLDAAMHARFDDLASYAVGTGAEAILFTCSAFGTCIEEVAQRHTGIPVLKPNEAMIADARHAAGPVGLVATFGPTLESMPAEFPADLTLRCALAEGALDALNRGDTALHDDLIAACARRLVAEGCATIVLAQFSMARAHDACVRACGVPVLTTVHSAVRELKRRLGGETG